MDSRLKIYFKLFVAGLKQLAWLAVPPFVFFWILHSTVLGWEYSTIKILSSQFIANYVLLSAIWCTFLIFIRRKLLSLFFASVVFEAIAQINLAKSWALFHPILPSDLFFIKNAPILVHFIPIVCWGLLGITVLVSAVALFRADRKTIKDPRIIRIAQPIVVALGFLTALTFGTNRFVGIRNWIGAELQLSAEWISGRISPECFHIGDSTSSRLPKYSPSRIS